MKRFFLLTTTLCIMFAMGLPTIVEAKKTIRDSGAFLRITAGETGISETDPVEVSGIVINAAFGLIGIIFLILMIYGGISWMLARENDEIATKARNTVKQAAIGLVILAGAYSITFMLTGLFQRGAKAGSPTNSAINSGILDRVE